MAAMPARKRPKNSPATSPVEASGNSVDRDLARFAAALEESARAKRRAAADAAAAAEHSRQLSAAQVELDRAIAEVRAAKAAGRATAEADTRWKAAKARVIELETGAAPSWAASTDTLAAEAESDSPADPSDVTAAEEQ
jgi:hypothetical protein